VATQHDGAASRFPLARDGCFHRIGRECVGRSFAGKSAATRSESNFVNQTDLNLRLLQLSVSKENVMEDDHRPVTVIRADLVRAKDRLAALGPDAEGTVHSFARHRVMNLAEELRAAEDAAESLAEAVALKWIYRYAVGGRLMRNEGESPQGT
jgi:hypothetical protein